MKASPKVTPVMFNGQMIHAHLDEIAVPGAGKRMTRRVVKPDHLHGPQYRLTEVVYGDIASKLSCRQPARTAFAGFNCYNHASPVYYASPYGKPGDLLWFRESMRVIEVQGTIGVGTTHVRVRYEADKGTSALLPWPSRLKEQPVLGRCLSNGGPRELSRMMGLITAIRVERLQDISEEDAAAEGVEQIYGGFWRHYLPGWTQHQLSAKGSFATLWKSIYGDAVWRANPWVWVTEYRPMLVNVDQYLMEAR